MEVLGLFQKDMWRLKMRSIEEKESNNYIASLQRKIQRLEALIKGKDAMLDTYEKTVFENKCETCAYYQEGKQPDGILWQSCDHDFQCANIYNFEYKAKETKEVKQQELIKACYTCKYERLDCSEEPCVGCFREDVFFWEAKDE